MGRTPEGIIEDHLRRQCKKLGFMCLKFTSPGNSGVPDRIVIGNGQTVFIELKKPGEVPRRLQQEVIADLRAAGAAVHIADTKSLVDDVLAKIIAGQAHSAPTHAVPEMLREQLAESLPAASPAQVDDLMAMAARAGRAASAAAASYSALV
jgi:hypothetical protein